MAKLGPDSDGLRGVIVNTASVAAFDGQVPTTLPKPYSLATDWPGCLLSLQGRHCGHDASDGPRPCVAGYPRVHCGTRAVPHAAAGEPPREGAVSLALDALEINLLLPSHLLLCFYFILALFVFKNLPTFFLFLCGVSSCSNCLTISAHR
jgi:hypothetical protein